MEIKTKLKQLIMTLLDNIHEQRKLILALSCVVVFVTTYVLILPAFTLDKEEAAEQGGIDVPGVEQSVDADETAEEPIVNETAKSSSKETAKSVAKNKSADTILENGESEEFSVAIESSEDVLTEDMSVAVREIDKSDKKQKKEYESLYNDALEAVQKAQEEEGLEKPSDFAFAKFYDISLMDGDSEVEPESAVDVKISFSEELQKELKVTDSGKVHIVHFAVDKETGEVTPDVLDTESTDITVEDNKVTEATFTADSFSVFAVVYTVDFHYEVNGKTYEFSIPGGGFVSLAKLVEVLGINGSTNEDGKVADSNKDGDKTTEELTLNDVVVSEATRELLADVTNVEFSNPELVDVSKVESNTTVGQIKESRGLEVQYSAELTEKQITEINSSTIEAGDWALISIRPFTSEEALTITMKNGDIWTVKLTDAQGTKWYGAADTRSQGITINLFDYGPDSLDNENNAIGSSADNYSNTGINKYSALKFLSHGTVGTSINHFTGSSPNEYAAQGIVAPKLVNGYPTLTSDYDNQSLAYLFDSSNRDGKTVYNDVNKLFWNSGNGYLYDSDVRYAYFNTNTNQNPNREFTLYTDTYNEEGADQANPFKVGFFPFNDYESYYNCIHGGQPNDPEGFGYYGSHWDGRWHHGLDKLGHYNHHFGMSMSATFELDSTKDMTFDFSGDDDMWVFVDDVLVLDIGGIHNPIDGSINFNNGNVSVTRPNSTADARQAVDNQQIAPDSIAEAFRRAGKTWNGADGTYHEIKVFYLERGGMYSNLEIEINLPTVLSGNVSFDKKDDDAAAVKGAEFSLYTDEDCQTPLSFKSENAKAVSDENGVVSFEGLPTGTYYMKETAVPAGYELDSSIYEVTIVNKNSGNSYIKNSNGQVVSEIINQKKVLNLSLEKKWDDNGDTNVPEGATATFILKQKKTTTPTPLTVKLVDVAGNLMSSVNEVYPGDTIKIYDSNSGTTSPKIFKHHTNAPWYSTGNINRNEYVYLTTLSDLNWTIQTDTFYFAYLEASSTSTSTGQYTVRKDDAVNGTVTLKLSNSAIGNNNYYFDNNRSPVLYVAATGTGPSPVDETVEYARFTLPTDGDDGDSWKKTFNDLPLEDKNGNQYSYYFEEVNHTPADYTIKEGNMGSATEPITESGDFVVTNKTPERPKITASKVWKDENGNPIDTESGLDGLEVKLTLYKGEFEAPSADVRGGEVTRTVSGNGSTTWVLGLQADAADYTVKETAVKIPGGEFVEIDPDTDPSQNPFGGVVTGDSSTGYTVTNQLPATEISVTKQWKDGTSTNGDKVFEEAENISFTLYQKLGDNDGAPYTIEDEPVTGTVTYTPASGSTAASWSTETISDLPKYVYSDGSWHEATYYPVEDDDDGVTVTYQKEGGNASEEPSDAAVTSGKVTIINTDIVAPLRIVKVDKDTDEGLTGASFQLTRKLPGENSFTKFVNNSFAEDPDNENKKTGPFTVSSEDGIIIEGLVPADYQIEEITAPDGYVITLAPFTFTVSADGTITSSNADSELIVPLNKEDSDPEAAGFKIGNVPGAELPHTGGIGTTVFYILGSIFVIAGAVYFIARRRIVN